MNVSDAKRALDSVITKSRVHFYKPIQVAEILFRDRVYGGIGLADLSTYRTMSKKWRDAICEQFLGRVSTSSAKYQDDIFSATAIPPEVLVVLGEENRQKGGIVEAYIYNKFKERFSQMSDGLNYCQSHDKTNFNLKEFLNLFWNEPGLRRSIDKIYEIVVYSIFSALVDALQITIKVRFNPGKNDVFLDFEDFTTKVLDLSLDKIFVEFPARINRVGVTNAADRGLDMFSNFGLAIQIKHLSLTEDLAEGIITSVSADRIVIVCKDAEEKVILSLLNQIGWKARIQSIITENELIAWYEKALRGRFAYLIGDNILNLLNSEIQVEFPATKESEFEEFYSKRGYNKLSDINW
jgi:Ni,Fe-hydrogenase III small subunit